MAETRSGHDAPTEWRLDYTAAGDELEADRLAALLAAYQGLVGHDLPNHLVAARGLAGLLAESDDRSLAVRLAELVGEADARCRRLAEIGRLLRQPAWGPPLPVCELAEEAVVTVRAGGCRADIRWEVACSGGTTRAARPLLHQVLVELLRNAAAATRGVVAVTTRGADLAVHDTGPGPAARPAHLAPLTQPPPPGHGLGLLLVHQAVARWRGRLTLSADAQGTTVTLSLPHAAAEGLP